MNQRDVATKWAKQSKPSAKASNLYFEGPVLYSYGPHFPLARLAEVNGERIAFINPNYYSHSTERHKYIANTVARYQGGRLCLAVLPEYWQPIIDGTKTFEEAAIALKHKEDAAAEQRRKWKREARAFSVKCERERVASWVCNALDVPESALPKHYAKQARLQDALLISMRSSSYERISAVVRGLPLDIRTCPKNLQAYLNVIS